MNEAIQQIKTAIQELNKGASLLDANLPPEDLGASLHELYAALGEIREATHVAMKMCGSDLAKTG